MMGTQGEWIDVCALEELDDGKPAKLEVGSREMTAVRLGSRVHLLPARCPHRGGRLHEGSLIHVLTASNPGQPVIECDTPVMVCPWHNWQFDLETGRTVFESNVRLPVVEARVAEGRVFARGRLRKASDSNGDE